MTALQPFGDTAEALKFDVLTDIRAELAESPTWDERRQCLFWCDIPRGLIWSFHPETGRVREYAMPGRVGSLGLCESGRLIVACERDVLFLDPDTGETNHMLTVQEDFAGRLNDGRVGPDGAYWVGSVSDVPLAQMQPVASLWRITRTSATRVQTGIKCSNGLAFGPDGKTLIHSDSVAAWVRHHRFDPVTGTVHDGRIICTPDEGAGRPDGAAMDVDGVYWSAGVSAGCLNAFDSDGRLLGRVATPVPHPTMPCFGGPDFRTLFLTSHRSTMTPDDLTHAPLSGRLLAARVQRPGFAAPRFKDLTP